MALFYIKNSGSSNEYNKVGEVVINGILLPLDVVININGNKQIARSQILDGVAVYERVTREPYQIDFDFTLREYKENKNENKSKTNLYIFPIVKLKEYFNSVWAVDSVVTVENEILNGLGINQLVINDTRITTLRGSVDIPVTLKCFEDYYSIGQKGTTLLI